MNFLRRTFPIAGILAYIGDAGAHVCVLLTSFRLHQLPLWAHIYFIVFGVWCALGMWKFASEARHEGCWWCGVYYILALHVTGASILHIYIVLFDDNEILEIFPRWYSWLGLAYCLFFAWYLWRLKVVKRSW